MATGPDLQQQAATAESYQDTAEQKAADEALAAQATAKDMRGKGKREPKAPPLIRTEEKLLGTAPFVPSTQQSIDELLAPYMKEMTNLGGEYRAEMEFLKPYLAPGYSSDALEQSIAKEYGGAGVEAPAGDKAQQALAGTEVGLAQVVENQVPPGFNAANAQLQQFEKSLPYADPIQAALGYQKYLETYGGLGTQTTGWPDYAQQAYSAITGATGSSPLGNPVAVGKDANAAKRAAQLLGGSTSSQGPSGTGGGYG